MKVRHTIRLAVVGVVLVAGAVACEPAAPPPPQDPVPAQPWYCAPKAFNSVTGIGMGTVDFYKGYIRKNLKPADCATLGTQIEQARAYAAQWPTRAQAEAGGWRVSFEYFSGMGTHHIKDLLTEEVLNSPSFDRHDPIFPGTSTFDPTRPNTLQFDQDGPTGELVGMSWYVRSTTGPPAGFAGTTDWWHHHPRLCVTRQDPVIVGINTSDAGCSGPDRVNLNMERYYMLHLWVVDGLEYEADVFAPMHPCIQWPDAVFDMDDPCHQQYRVPNPRGRSAPGTSSPLGFCPLGSAPRRG